MSSTTPEHPAKNKKRLAILFALVVFLLLTVFALAQWFKRIANPLSEDAVLGAPIVNISAGVPGKIHKMNVQDGQYVKEGEVLFEIDPTFYELRFEQAKAELQLAEATLDSKGRVIKAEEHNAQIAEEQVQRARENLKMATQTHQRLAELAPKGYVPKQQLDESRTLMRDAEISLSQALEQQQAADSLVSNTAAEQAIVSTRVSGLAMAEYELSKTKVNAPFSGRIVGLNTREGEQVLPGASVFSLVDVDNSYATAYFKETDLDRIQKGDCATVYILADSSRPAKGVVDSIGWGVTSTEQIDLPFELPYVQKTLNWVHIAQRFPVRIRLQDAPSDLLRAGASANVVIHSKEQCE